MQNASQRELAASRHLFHHRIHKPFEQAERVLLIDCFDIFAG
jgi:hypothetical protein